MSKRSRIGRSSSQGEIGVFLPFDSPQVFFEKKYPTPAETKKISRCILTVDSPEREKSDDEKSNKIKKPGEGFGEFIHTCYFCKKRFKDNLFMYGYLGAFCTRKCREDQMALDGFE